jgi:hypothetical protein
VRAVTGSGVAGAPVRVTLTADDVSGIDLAVPDRATAVPIVEGHWRVEGEPRRPSRHALSPCEEGIRVLPVDGNPRWAVVAGEGPEAEAPWLGEDGTFEFTLQPPGTSWVHVQCPGRDVYLADARVDGVSVLGRAFTLEPSTRHRLEVVFSRRAGRVVATVSSAGDGIDGSRIVLAPLDRSRVDLFQSGLADARGQVEFHGVAPGLYDVMAWPALPENAWFDAAVMDGAAGWRRVITVHESTATMVTVDLVPHGQ